jgi:hypothetical protein
MSIKNPLLSQGYYKNPGKIYITDANAQQLIWSASAIGIATVYKWVDSFDNLVASLVTDYSHPTQTICDCTDFKLSQGFYAKAGFNNIAFLIGNSQLNNFADHQTIWNLTIKDKILTSDFDYFRSSNLEILDRSLPSSSYYAAISKSCYRGLDDLKENFVNYLDDLTSPDLKLWLSLNTHTAMRLFKGRNNFLDYISNPSSGKCRALGVYLAPFVKAFLKTANVSYLHAFARWVYLVNVRGPTSKKLGVSKYERFYYCNFDSKSQIAWQQAIRTHKLYFS